MALKILLTNDDGIYAEGMKILINKVKDWGEILICAPLTEQSAKSHAVNLRSEIKIEKIDYYQGIEAYAIDSTPADCVRYATHGLNYDFDLLISGINDGYNVGMDIMYSGTVAATFEACSTGKKALAISTTSKDFTGAIKWFDKVMEYIKENELFNHGLLYNINFPSEPQGIKITKQGGINYTTYYIKNENGYVQSGDPIFNKNPEEMFYDTSCVMNNFISITPLTCDRTDIEVYNKIKFIIK